MNRKFIRINPQNVSNNKLTLENIDGNSSLDWNQIKWKKVEHNVYKFQCRIYRATKLGKRSRIRKLQKILLSSYEAKLLAVKRVTQENRGKNTSGIDGIKSIPKNNRITLAKSLNIPSLAKSVKRVYINKSNKTEKRPLGIPTIKDRALQSLVKQALEPE